MDPILSRYGPSDKAGTVHDLSECLVCRRADRLTHHAEILTIEGESYRKREAELAQKARRSAP
jgi:hypothetical protein